MTEAIAGEKTPSKEPQEQVISVDYKAGVDEATMLEMNVSPDWILSRRALQRLVKSEGQGKDTEEIGIDSGRGRFHRGAQISLKGEERGLGLRQGLAWLKHLQENSPALLGNVREIWLIGTEGEISKGGRGCLMLRSLDDTNWQLTIVYRNHDLPNHAIKDGSLFPTVKTSGLK